MDNLPIDTSNVLPMSVNVIADHVFNVAKERYWLTSCSETSRPASYSREHAHTFSSKMIEIGRDSAIEYMTGAWNLGKHPANMLQAPSLWELVWELVRKEAWKPADGGDPVSGSLLPHPES